MGTGATSTAGGVNVNEASATSLSFWAMKPATVIVHLVMYPWLAELVSQDWVECLRCCRCESWNLGGGCLWADEDA